MNRSFLIILIPALAVAVYFIFALRHFGWPTHYVRLGVVFAGFLVALWLVRRRSSKKANPGGL
jgi:hypothetical protein